MSGRPIERPRPALELALAAVEMVNNRPNRSRSLAEQAKATADGDPETISVAERALGMVFTLSGDLSSARDCLCTAVAVADAAGLATRSAEARGSLAYVLMLTGTTAEALTEIDRALPGLQGAAAARLRMMQGLVLTEIGRHDAAESAFAQALTLLAAAGGNGLLEADIRNNRAILRIHRRDWAAVERDLLRAEALYLASDQLGRTALVFHNRGLAATTRGDLPVALAAFDEAERRYRAAGRSPGLLPVERAEGLLSVLLVAEARQSATTAVAEFAAAGNAVDLVQARLVLARAALLDGDPQEARLEADRARRAALRQQRPGWASLAGHLALRASWQAGRYTRSTIGTGRRTVAALNAAGLVVAALDAQLVLARVALALGQLRTARKLLADAATASDEGPAELRAGAWHARALLSLADGDAPGAQRALGQGMRVLDDFRASLGATELRAQVSGHAGELAELGLRLAVDGGRPEQVLEWAERWRAGALRLRPVRPPDAADLAQELAELRQIAAQLSTGPDPERAASLVGRQTELEKAIAHRARHADGATAGADGEPLSPAELRDALAGRALVEFVKIDRQLLAVVVSERDVATIELGPFAAVEHELDALRYALRRLAYGFGTPESLAAASRLVEQKARRLDELLLQPVRAEIGAGPLVLIPTSGLHAMPWAVLPSLTGRPVSVAPSAALWYRAAGGDVESGGRRVLVCGPDLPHAAAEVATLARMYRSATRLTGVRAVSDRVIAALEGAELAHIAAHGHFRADNPLFSSLQLHDGPLTVHDLEGLARAPRHVVLSACESGLPTVHPGDEILGLAAALLALGTSSLVATVAPIPDDASRPLMLRFHGHLRRGLTPAAALALAQQELLSLGSPAEAAAAAGFVCFGAG